MIIENVPQQKHECVAAKFYIFIFGRLEMPLHMQFVHRVLPAQIGEEEENDKNQIEIGCTAGSCFFLSTAQIVISLSSNAAPTLIFRFKVEYLTSVKIRLEEEMQLCIC